MSEKSKDVWVALDPNDTSVIDDKVQRHKNAQKKYRQAHPDRVKATKNNWRLANPEKCKEHRKTFRANHPDVAKEWAQKHRERMRELSKIWAEKNPEKRKAYMVVAHALEDGIISKRPCEICGVKRVHAHHDDYNKPLEMVWLCPKHHKEIHTNI